MRLHRSRNAVAALCVAAGGFVIAPRVSAAQAPEGAIFLLIPVGARAVGQGQAVAASRLGVDGVWWNPAAVGWVTERELTAHYSGAGLLTGNAVDFVQPAGRAGVVAASLLYINIGDQPATDDFGNETGKLYTYARALSASYGATFGDRVAAGVSYKLATQASSCSGSCPGLVTGSISFNMFDFGIHAIVDKGRALTVGAAIRNAGLAVQTIDAEQSDPPPTTLHVGAEYDVRRVAQAMPGARLRVSGELVERLALHHREARLGVELALADVFSIRGGLHGGTLDQSYASVGFGVRRGTLGFDFARIFGGLLADFSDPPTYVTFRMAFR